MCYKQNGMSAEQKHMRPGDYHALQHKRRLSKMHQMTRQVRTDVR